MANHVTFHGCYLYPLLYEPVMILALWHIKLKQILGTLEFAKL